MRSRDPFGVVLEELRGRIRRGDIAPGEPLIVLDLARSLALSATPVREALAHLAGEGLIDGRRDRARGYATWRLGAADLSDLYRLHAAQVLLALDQAARRGAALGLEDILRRFDDRARRADLSMTATEAVFDRIAEASDSLVVRRAHRAVADRLHLVRLRGEPVVIADLGEELVGLAALEAGGVPLAQAVRAYHRRRILAAERLVSAVARPGLRIPV